MHGVLLSLICWALFAALGAAFSRPFLALFTDNPAILSMGTDYLQICTAFSCGVFLLFTAERLMQATGKTVYHMVIQCIGALINVVLDPILIFGLFGCPAFGVAGAAAATVIGQCVAIGHRILFEPKTQPGYPSVGKRLPSQRCNHRRNLPGPVCRRR